MLVVLAIVAILATFAAPSFGQLFARRAVIAAASTLASDYRYARSEAIKLSGYVTVCRSTDGTSCATTAGSWHTGWLVFADNDGNGTLDSGTDEILRVQQELLGISSLANPTLSSTLIKATFRPNGLGIAINDSLVVTPSTSSTGLTRLLCISSQGRMALRDEGTNSCA